MSHSGLYVHPKGELAVEDIVLQKLHLEYISPGMAPGVLSVLQTLHAQCGSYSSNTKMRCQGTGASITCELSNLISAFTMNACTPWQSLVAVA